MNTVKQKELISFSPIDKFSEEDFLSFRYSNYFSDTAFSMLYAWNEEFNYSYRKYEDAMVISGTGSDNLKSYMIVKNSSRELFKIIACLSSLCREENRPLIIKYIAEKDIGSYESICQSLDIDYTFDTDEKYDDYIYSTKEFVSIFGGRNKSKRGNYRYFLKNSEDLSVYYYDSGMYADVMSIFDKWCSCNNCADCYYGCEKRAFTRFMEIYNPNFHRIAVSYMNDVPLSFAVYEKINGNTASYYFQKNSVRSRGLTYWLNRETALMHSDIEYINLGEDMGIKGLRMDKTNLHPCRKIKKYILTIK